MKAEADRSAPGTEAHKPGDAHDQEESSTAADPRQTEGETFETGKIVRGVLDIPEVATYAKRIGATHRGLRKLAVTTRHGRYRVDRAEIRFGDLGTIDAPEDYEPTDDEQDKITKAWERYTWPVYQPCLYTGKSEPRNDPRYPWSSVSPENVAVCWDRKREFILCVEVRIPLENGDKAIVIWSPFDDQQWRIAEPDPLPLYGLDQIEGASTIYIHEGPKAARAVRRMLDDDGLACPNGGWREHPMGRELRTEGKAAHVAYMGGANRAGATDWSPLQSVSATIIAVPDNDDEGREGIRPMSRAIRREMYAVRFDRRWPNGWDFADPMPETLFDRSRPRVKQYVGPSLRDLIRPITWATVALPRQADEEGRGQRGQTGFRILPQFAKQWVYIEQLGVFVNLRDPRTFYDDKTFNNAVRPFSDVKDTAAQMHKLWSIKAEGFAFEPGVQPGLVNIGSKLLLNVHVSSEIEAMPGDPRPWLKFLRHLFPNRASRRHVERWVATLRAKPDIRILYALLLVSRTHGVGKNTLVHVIRMLLGPHNCSSTTAKEITGSAFNSWIAEKRLVEVDEVYAGHSSELANTIKPLITGTEVPVNRKFKEPYTISNKAHFVMMSNSRLPVFVEEKDRRWLIPEVTERTLPVAYWAEFHRWLQDGGINIIAHWCERFCASTKRGPVVEGAHAPLTRTKAQMIDESRSGAERQVRELGEFLIDRAMGDPAEKIILPTAVLMAWFRGRENLSSGDRKISERAVLEMLPEGLEVRRKDDRIETGRGRKITAVINFAKTSDHKWPDLIADGSLWDLERLRREFDAF